jgi:hypothetical protein
MRTAPVRRDEVRIDAQWRIRTLPADACRRIRYPARYGYDAIPELFTPLVEELRQERVAWLADWQAQSAAATGIDRAFMMLAAGEPKIRRRLNSLEPRIPWPDGYPVFCRHCKREFFHRFRARPGAFCSDRCIAAHKNATHIAQLSQARRAARADRVCEQCDAPLDAARSSKRYCSNRCRTAALRRRRTSA